MKRTLLTFFVALAGFLAALALPRPSTDTGTLSLDFDGIDTLVVDSHSYTSIVLTDLASARLEYALDDAPKTRVTRDGHTLRVSYSSEGYGALTLRVPTTLRILVVDGGSVKTSALIDELEIRTSAGVTWDGPIKRLRVVDTRNRSRCGRECGATFAVQGGRVDALVVITRDGDVNLSAPDLVGTATLVLGKDATYTIQNATRIANLRLLPFAESTLPASGAVLTPRKP